MDILFSCCQSSEIYRILLDYNTSSSKTDSSLLSYSALPSNQRTWRGTLSLLRCSLLGTGLRPRPTPKPTPPPLDPTPVNAPNSTPMAAPPSLRLCFQIEKLVFSRRYTEALNLFQYLDSMEDSEIGGTTYDAMATACIEIGSAGGARMLHMNMVRTRFVPDTILTNRVLFMFIKCGMHTEASDLFHKIRDKDVTSLEMMVGGFVNSGHYLSALRLFMAMWRRGPREGAVGPKTLVALMRASIGLAALSLGRQLHACAVKTGLSDNVFLSCASIDMYSKCGAIEGARQVFDEMPEKTTVGWNTTMAGYALHGYNEEALNMFYGMRRSGAEVDHFTFSTLVRICTRLASPRRVGEIHARLLRCGRRSDAAADTALVDFYGKWGEAEQAEAVFRMMPDRNVMSWNALIAGYGIHGRGPRAARAFESMVRAGVVPDHVTFLAVLTACTRSGMRDYAWGVFRSMGGRFGVSPRPMHYACAVELLGREGDFESALELVRDAPFDPTVNMWAAFVTACRAHRNVELGRAAAEKIYEMGPDKVSNYVMLLNLYKKSGETEAAEMVIQAMRRRGMEMRPSCSWVDVDKQLHAFSFVGGREARPGGVYEELERLTEEVRGFGYVEGGAAFLAEVGEEEAGMVRYHSEKLAVAYGVMSTDEWVPLQVMQSHRMCEDCHVFIKLVSVATRRKIVVRDGTRFHHFREGRCSCGDYW